MLFALFPVFFAQLARAAAFFNIIRLNVVIVYYIILAAFMYLHAPGA